MNVVKVIYVILVVKSYYLNEKRKFSEYVLNWMCVCDFKCVYCFLMNWKYMDFYIDIRMFNDSFFLVLFF